MAWWNPFKRKTDAQKLSEIMRKISTLPSSDKKRELDEFDGDFRAFFMVDGDLAYEMLKDAYGEEKANDIKSKADDFLRAREEGVESGYNSAEEEEELQTDYETAEEGLDDPIEEVKPRQASIRREEATKGKRNAIGDEVQVLGGTDGTFMANAFRSFLSRDGATEIDAKTMISNLNKATVADRKETYNAISDTIKEAISSKSLQDIPPKVTDEPNVTHYGDGNKSLSQEERDDGMFRFTPAKDFTGILRVQRRDANGDLMPNSVDIIEYKGGKPVFVVPGPEGKSRVADFGAIAQAAGISVSVVKETGISVSTGPIAKEEKKEKEVGHKGESAAEDEAKKGEHEEKEEEKKQDSPVYGEEAMKVAQNIGKGLKWVAEKAGIMSPGATPGQGAKRDKREKDKGRDGPG